VRRQHDIGPDPQALAQLAVRPDDGPIADHRVVDHRTPLDPRVGAHHSADDPRPYYNIGVIYQQTLHDKEALEYFLMSLARDSRYLPSLRGATASGKRLDVTDEAALKRVRTALLIETDPRWRSIFETETLRIEGSLQRAGKSTSGI